MYEVVAWEYADLKGEMRTMGKFEVITPIGSIEIMADEMQIIISDLRFMRNGQEIARFDGDKIYGWIDRTGEANDSD